MATRSSPSFGGAPVFCETTLDGAHSHRFLTRRICGATYTVHVLSQAAVERWKKIRDAAVADPDWSSNHRQLVARRAIVKQEILSLTQDFLGGRIDPETLRATFDGKTRTVWAGFGLKGMSYAMFLNKLLKYVAAEPTLSDQLHATLALPESGDAGYTALRSFHNWLMSLVAQGLTTRKAVQPARAPSFVSAFWHMQAVAEWPIYYESARSAFERDQLIDPPTDVVDAYFQFRDVFQELRDRVGIDTWMLEQLCHRPVPAIGADSSSLHGADISPNKALTPRSHVETATEPVEPAAEDVAGHAHVQWLLATTGRELGCQVWIAANDRSKQWNGTTLGSLSIKTLPRLGLDEDVARRLGFIDVLWLKGNRVYAAFEVEHTTSIYSGLLRLSDLVAAAPNLTFRLYIVVPELRIGAVEAELRRPTFQTLELHKFCGFFSEERLLRERDGMMRWASDPRAIDKLATYVGDNEAD